MLQTMGSVKTNIQANENEIKRVAEESRRRHESAVQKNHQIERSVNDNAVQTKQTEIRRNRGAAALGYACFNEPADPESEEMVVGGFQLMMAHEAVETAR